MLEMFSLLIENSDIHQISVPGKENFFHYFKEIKGAEGTKEAFMYMLSLLKELDIDALFYWNLLC